MEIKDIIESGILEEYCLGTLPKSKAEEISRMAQSSEELNLAIEQVLLSLQSIPNGLMISDGLKPKVLNRLFEQMSSHPIDLQNPPIIDKYADYKAWTNAVAEKTSEVIENGYEISPLFINDKLELHLVWLHTELIEEAHSNNFRESFLILDGECECNFDGLLVRFKKGDYFEIPSETRHVIRNITHGGGCVKGIVQRLAA